MARYKNCPCGKALPLRRDLCAGCLEEYGTVKAEWPEWMRFAVKDLQREFDHDRNHDDYEIFNSAGMEGEDRDDSCSAYTLADEAAIEDEVVSEDEAGVITITGPGSYDDSLDVMAAFDKLDEKLRTAITLRSQGYSHQEVADEMGVSLPTAKRYAKAAQEELKNQLG